MQNMGYTDRPIESVEEDLFNIKKYISGLGRFISKCETPMTIAIQGDWGSGKTSFMKMVRRDIDTNVIPIWFNTWEFSQFNMDDRLAITLMEYLADELQKQVGSEVTKQLKKSLKTIVSVAGAVFDGVSGTEAGTTALNALSGEESLIGSIDRLKDKFQDAVKELVREKKNGRVAIFIDDLDRLQPVRAVELLEILKLFLDCQNCVFILAIDYEVVSQGIKEKYNGMLDGVKGRKFFDKIIQVPFKMPVAVYDINNYVSQSLERLNIRTEKDRDKYQDLISVTVGYNPRAMKRLFNAYLLLREVNVDTQILDKEDEQLLLFACLCMQLSYEEVYNYLVARLNSDDGVELGVQFFGRLLRGDDIGQLREDSSFDDLMVQIEEKELVKEREIYEFLAVFAGIIGPNNEITDQDIERLQSILSMASVTASGMDKTPLSRASGRRQKVYAEGAKEFSLDDLDVGTLNSCIIEAYRIGETERRWAGEKGLPFSDFYRDVLTYIYRQDKDRFETFRKEALAGKFGKKFVSLFDIEKNRVKSAVTIEGTNIRVSTYTSNDDKRKHLLRICKELGVDSAMIRIKARLARDMEIQEEMAFN